MAPVIQGAKKFVLERIAAPDGRGTRARRYAGGDRFGPMTALGRRRGPADAARGRRRRRGRARVVLAVDAPRGRRAPARARRHGARRRGRSPHPPQLGSDTTPEEFALLMLLECSNLHVKVRML